MNVQEAAHRLGVSPRRVRAMAADGRLRAQKHGRTWEIEELTTPKVRRALSVRSWQHLSLVLKQRSLARLSGQERLRAAERIRQLRQAEFPSRLLIDWKPADATPDAFLDSLVGHATRGDDAYVKRALVRPPEYLRRNDDLAQVVSSERAFRGKSRQWLAEAAGVAVEQVREIELSRPLRSPGVVRRVLRALDIEPTALPEMVRR